MPTTFITGATDGIGYALGKLYDGRGDRVVLLGRRALEALDDPFFTADNYVQADLTDTNAPEIVTAWLETHGIEKIDTLIHNAGMGYYGAVVEQEPENIMALVDVGYRAPVLLTHALVPWLAGGHITFVSSVASAIPNPDYAVYTAVKAALDGFAHNLRMELEPKKIGVTVVHPGATRTGMHEKANMPGDTSRFASAGEVAAAIMRATDAEVEATAIGAVNKVLRFVGTHFAGLVDSAMKRSRA